MEAGGTDKGSDRNNNKETESQQSLRLDLVGTAVKFLENPKVAKSKDEVKRGFLKKKGLTEAEINEAFKKASPPPLPVQHQQVYQAQTHPVGEWGLLQQVRDIGNFAALFIGAFYGLKLLWERYVRKWLFGEASKSTLEIVLDEQKRTLMTIQTLTKSVEQLVEQMTDQSAKISRVLNADSSAKMEELQNEFRSVKSLMLSSSRFPANPPVSVPSVPAWQLNSKLDDKDKAGISGDDESKASSSNPDLITDNRSDPNIQNSVQ